MVVGIGTDIIETKRIQVLIERHQERFLRRWFSDREIEYCERKAKPYIHFAARFAAKEAAFKVLHLQSGVPICWKDITIEKGDDGSPFLSLRGEPLAEAEKLGISTLHLSISHCDQYAVATVIAESIR